MENEKQKDRIEQILYEAFTQIAESRPDIAVTYSPNSGCIFFRGTSGTEGRLEAKYTPINTIALYLTIKNFTVQTEQSNLKTFIDAIVKTK